MTALWKLHRGEVCSDERQQWADVAQELLTKGWIIECRDAPGRPPERHVRRSVEELTQPAFRVLQRKRRRHIFLSDGREANTFIETGISISRCEINTLLPKHCETMGNQSLPETLALSLRSYRDRIEDKDRARVTYKS